MQVIQLDIPDVLLLQIPKHGDDRGFVSEVYSERAFLEAGISNRWVQDNHAKSSERHVLRGLHFQVPPHAQAKLVRVARGRIFDVAVDVRAGSPWYGKWVGKELSASAWNQLYVPAGFAHGYLTLEPDCEVLYKVDDYYAPDCEGGLIWNDPDLAIDWPLQGHAPILSKNDELLPRFKDFRTPFSYG